ncbi:MAG: nucleotidyltransferase family protein, partial [Erysipelotrichaceae bacterium]
YGVDLVIELPSYFVAQNASIFAQAAIDSLAIMQVDSVCFGSESDIEYLNLMSEININVDHLKEIMKSGDSYASALGRLTNCFTPNDILAISYLKQLKNYPNIQPINIIRTNDYHDQNIQDNNFSSATSIRNAMKNKSDFSTATPISDLLRKYENINSYYFPILKNKIISLTKDQLNQILLVDEGIENLMKKNILIYDNYEDFVNSCVSRRYSKSRISRICLHIILNTIKKDIKIDGVRVLAFNDTGRSYLRQLKEQEVNVYTKFNQIPYDIAQYEYLVSQIYSLYYQDKSIGSSEVVGAKYYQKKANE